MKTHLVCKGSEYYISKSRQVANNLQDTTPGHNQFQLETGSIKYAGIMELTSNKDFIFAGKTIVKLKSVSSTNIEPESEISFLCDVAMMILCLFQTRQPQTVNDAADSAK